MKLLVDNRVGRNKGLRQAVSAKAFIGGRSVAYIVIGIISACLLYGYAIKKDDEANNKNKDQANSDCNRDRKKTPIERTKSAQSYVDLQVLFNENHPLPPAIFKLFLGWISDKEPVITSMSLTGISHSNMFANAFRQEIDENGRRWYFKKSSEDKSDKSEFGYTYIGRLTTGHHVIMTVDITTGSGVFYSILFITQSETNLLDFTNVGSVRSKLTPSINYEGSYPLVSFRTFWNEI